LSQQFLPNFSKEFYHWLAVSDNEAQRVCITLVACFVLYFWVGIKDSKK